MYLLWGRTFVRGSETESLIKNDLREKFKLASSTFDPYDWFTVSLKTNLSTIVPSKSKKITTTLSTNP